MSSSTSIAERIASLRSPTQRSAQPCLPDCDEVMRELGRTLQSHAFRRSPKGAAKREIRRAVSLPPRLVDDTALYLKFYILDRDTLEHVRAGLEKAGLYE